MSDLLRLASAAERNALPTVSWLSETDVDSIWGYGVHVAGLGTFTFSQLKLDVGNQLLVVQRPVFLLAEKLVQSQNLKQHRALGTATHIPVVALNYAAVSQDGPFERDVVEGCVRETLLLLPRGLASGHPAHLALQGVGTLSFKNNLVRMKFHRDFVNTLDSTGRLLMRPGSSVSLMSRGGPLTPVGTTRLPSVVSPPCGVLSGAREGRGPPLALDSTETAAEGPVSGGPRPSRPQASGGLEAKGCTTQAADKSSISFSPPEGATPEEETHRDRSCTGHTRAGQELCYVCMQRAQRNAQLSQQRAFSQQVAAFNLEASQTLKEQRAQRPQFHGSYLFSKRPLTAALRGARQRGHVEDLRDQLVSQRIRSHQAQQERLLLEKVDQAQLAHELALQRKQQLVQKQQRVDRYRRALDVEHGKAPSSTQNQQPISAGIGRCETAAAANENRERAQKVSQEQLMAATQKRREEALILEHIARFETTKDLRASLEDAWRTNNRLKLRREEDENSFRRFGGDLLLDQCSQHRRCHQCKRKPGNHGDSNIWKESYYSAGSRVMM
ncbi:hypothetical protein NHX12_005461 [Muraenolepis orangiensis]|uniref:CCDC81 HU domain-containing protein n=1 Tax=Muraenolepis orangiensis TaxID=630683 RepID=A0A9Q0IC14_9TELE|nr:hypothetical protein NHX12_005461 [Muraenolepis orangiensis]